MALPLTNAANPLTTPTYDGSGETVHPYVIDFLEEQAMSTWAGYRYWMIMTPFPSSNDAYENPSLLASADGTTWVVPAGITNPLDTPPSGYNSDTTMVYDPVANHLKIYWGNGLTVRYCTVDSNMNVSAVSVIMTTTNPDTPGSLQIWRESATRWHMWNTTPGSTSGGTSAVMKVRYRFSADGVTWDGASSTPCMLECPTSRWPWHIGMHPNYDERRIDFLITLTENATAAPTAGTLSYAYCDFDDLTHLRAFTYDLVLQPAVGAWDNQTIYQSTAVPTRNGEDDTYNLWYSAKQSTNHWRIGLLSAQTIFPSTRNEVSVTSSPAEYFDNQGLYKRIDTDLSIPIDSTTVATWATAAKPSAPIRGEIGLNTDTFEGDVYIGNAWETLASVRRFDTVTGHDHDGVDSKQVDHTTLSNKGTYTHSQIDNFIDVTAPAAYMNTAGDSGTGPFIFNSLKNATADFTIHGDTVDNILVADVSANAVGFGTATPSSSVHVYAGNLKVEGNTTGTGATARRIDIINEQDSTNAYAVLAFTSKATTPVSGQFYSDGFGTSPLGAAGIYMGAFSNHKLGLYTNNLERISIAAGGLVGIGSTTNAPTEKLHVYNGAIKVGYETDTYDELIMFRRNAVDIGAVDTNGNNAVRFKAMNNKRLELTDDSGTGLHILDGGDIQLPATTQKFYLGATGYVDGTNNRLNMATGGQVPLGQSFYVYGTHRANGFAAVSDADMSISNTYATRKIGLTTATGVGIHLKDGGYFGMGTNAPTSTAHINGSLTLNYRGITALRTLDDTDYLVDCTANTFTVTLPTAASIAGRIYKIKNSGTGVITLATTSSQTIDGITTQTLNQYDCIEVMSNGSNWIIT